MPNRRTVLQLAAAPFLLRPLGTAAQRARRVVVVGAGAFGGWTALHLARRGARVTLVDAWGPGNARASSGGETRVIRSAYGDRAIYTRLAARALTLWRDFERETARRFYVRTGALWMFEADAAFADASVNAMTIANLPAERPSLEAARARWPQIDFAGVRSVLYEPEAGYLLARQSCAEVAARARAMGAEYRTGAARPGALDGPLSTLRLADGDALAGDTFVFACGPWLGTLFPDVVGQRIRPTRQEVFYFGPAAGDTRFEEERLPVWVSFGERIVYGVPGNAHRGFKIADDSHGPAFDPTAGERHVSAAGIAGARSFLRKRFPALQDAPFLGGEVCQYENSPDGHFILDRHPRAANVWLVGGGSGHGFKMGPAVGEIVASLVLSDGVTDPQFALRRLDGR